MVFPNRKHFCVLYEPAFWHPYVKTETIYKKTYKHFWNHAIRVDPKAKSPGCMLLHLPSDQLSTTCAARHAGLKVF